MNQAYFDKKGFRSDISFESKTIWLRALKLEY